MNLVTGNPGSLQGGASIVTPDTPLPQWRTPIGKLVNSLAIGYTYSIAQNGDVIETGTWGYARSLWEQDEPGALMLTDSQLCIASVSKTLTTVALLKWIEDSQGTEGVDNYLQTPFWTLVPDGTITDWGENVQTVTLQNLLQQKSGMPQPNTGLWSDYWSQMTWWCAQTATDPGSTRNYNNNNFSILQCIVENLSGMSYEDYLQQAIFAPMGMESMQSDAPTGNSTLTYNTTDVEQEGAGHQLPTITCSTATGGWIGTGQALSQFLVGVRDYTVLSETTTATMLDELLGWDRQTSVADGSCTWQNGAIYSSGKGLNSAIVRFPNNIDAAILLDTYGPEFRDNDLWQPATLMAVYNELVVIDGADPQNLATTAVNNEVTAELVGNVSREETQSLVDELAEDRGDSELQ